MAYSFLLIHPLNVIYVRQKIPLYLSKLLWDGKLTPVWHMAPFCSPSDPHPNRVVPGANLSGVTSRQLSSHFRNLKGLKKENGSVVAKAVDSF